MNIQRLKSNLSIVPLPFKIIISAIIIVVLANIYFYIKNELKIDIVKNCKVIDLQQQQIIKGSSSSVKTEIRYLVITDKETFICESSLLNEKFNNSDLYLRLKKDSVYTFRVAGFGKSVIYDYRNILEVVK